VAPGGGRVMPYHENVGPNRSPGIRKTGKMTNLHCCKKNYAGQTLNAVQSVTLTSGCVHW